MIWWYFEMYSSDAKLRSITNTLHQLITLSSTCLWHWKYFLRGTISLKVDNNLWILALDYYQHQFNKGFCSLYYIFTTNISSCIRCLYQNFVDLSHLKKHMPQLKNKKKHQIEISAIPGSILTGLTFCCWIFCFHVVKPLMPIWLLLSISAILWKTWLVQSF